MRKQFLLFILSSVISIPMVAQNLVPNPGFEEFYNCPNKLSQFHNVVNWYTPTVGNPDFYNTCQSRPNKEPFGVPYNIYGMQKPQDGNGYAGLVLYNAVNNRLIEYIQIELPAGLKSNANYKLSFSVSLSENSKFAISTVEGLITKNAISSNFWQPLFEKAQVRYSSADALTNTEVWTEVSGEFEAEGGEKFLTIGNFANKNESFVEHIEGGDKLVAYYYIDNVQLVEIEKPVSEPIVQNIKIEDQSKKKKSKRKRSRLGNKPKKSKKKNLGTNTNIVTVEPVYFITNTTELIGDSHEELDEIVDLLNTYAGMGLIVRTNTSLNGTESSNMRLARERADAVVEHLLGHDINRNRIKVEYIGSPTFVERSSSPAENQKNHRIEFLIKRFTQ